MRATKQGALRARVLQTGSRSYLRNRPFLIKSFAYGRRGAGPPGYRNSANSRSIGRSAFRRSPRRGLSFSRSRSSPAVGRFRVIDHPYVPETYEYV